MVQRLDDSNNIYAVKPADGMGNACYVNRFNLKTSSETPELSTPEESLVLESDEESVDASPATDRVLRSAAKATSQKSNTVPQAKTSSKQKDFHKSEEACKQKTRR